MRILLALSLLILLMVACASGLTEPEVREIIQEHSTPGPAGPQGERGWPEIPALRENLALPVKGALRVNRE